MWSRDAKTACVVVLSFFPLFLCVCARVRACVRLPLACALQGHTAAAAAAGDCCCCHDSSAAVSGRAEGEWDAPSSSLHPDSDNGMLDKNDPTPARTEAEPRLCGPRARVWGGGASRAALRPVSSFWCFVWTGWPGCRTPTGSPRPPPLSQAWREETAPCWAHSFKGLWWGSGLISERLQKGLKGLLTARVRRNTPHSARVLTFKARFSSQNSNGNLKVLRGELLR